MALNTNYLAPSGREEAWRFTPLNRLGGLLDAEVELSSSNSLLLKEEVAGAKFEYVASESASPISQTNDEATLRVRNCVDEVGVLTILRNSEISQPIILDRITKDGQPEASRFLIKAGENSHSTVIISNQGNAILAEDIEISLDQGATLTLVSLQEWDSKTVHLGREHAVIGKDATFNSIIVTIGGSLVRLLPTVEYSGQGSSADLSGLYFATDGQHLEHRMHVDHNIPNAKSRVNYKGALAGDKARTVWIGDVYIHAEAEGTDTYELNRNLLLSDGARADSVPNLEIETGEIVGAGHASTTGRFDDEQLFYLSSRGIPADEARGLVIRGFFQEIVNKIKGEEIQERLMARIDLELAKVGAIK
jgi:Fe-S cluster assembly protein SufD